MSHPAREKLRQRFLEAQRWGDAAVIPLQPDASFRQYLRLRQGARAALLMDAPPPEEDVGAFVRVTRHLEKIGVRVPQLYAEDRANGFLLLEDLGDRTFTRLLAAGHDETALYTRAVNVLAHIQHVKHAPLNDLASDFKPYDTARALAEATLLLDWYLPARLERPVSATARADFTRCWHDLLTALPPLKPTLVLRDYHIDNLMMVGDENASECALLDYQDAVLGSPAYDLVCLLEDARRDLAPTLVDSMQHLFWEQIQPTDIDPQHLRQHYQVWGAQRHCKVAGIFVRLWLRDGKDGYLHHLPRVLKLLQRHLHTPTLAPLRHWLDAQLGGQLGKMDHVAFTAPAARMLRHCARAQ